MVVQSTGTCGQGGNTSLTDLHDLFVEQLQDLYSAEQQFTEAQAKIADQTATGELQQGVQAHLAQTREHARRLNHPEAVTLLEQTLSEEKATDAKLSQPAESTINAQAA